MGNLFSVERVCEKVGLIPQKTSDPHLIMKSDALILPGVGAFGDAIESLKRLDLITPLKDFIETSKPFLGVCLGMQLLFSESEEFGPNKGLDVIQGTVKRFPLKNKRGQILKIPHVGWNRIYPPLGSSSEHWGKTLLSGTNNGEYMYFVHSYYPVPEKEELSLTSTIYEEVSYCSAIFFRNVIAFQFHPEKSGKAGIRILENLKTMLEVMNRSWKEKM